MRPGLRPQSSVRLTRCQNRRGLRKSRTGVLGRAPSDDMSSSVGVEAGVGDGDGVGVWVCVAPAADGATEGPLESMG